MAHINSIKSFSNQKRKPKQWTGVIEMNKTLTNQFIVTDTAEQTWYFFY